MQAMLEEYATEATRATTMHLSSSDTTEDELYDAQAAQLSVVSGNTSSNLRPGLDVLRFADLELDERPFRVASKEDAPSPSSTHHS